MSRNRILAVVCETAATAVFLTIVCTANGDSYKPAEWINDPFCLNTNFALVDANSGNPSFRNNGIQRGTLYANSAIGATLKLAQPGDTISFAGQVALNGDVNPDGNLQFRAGLYYQGTNTADTNWLGYTFGNATGDPSAAATGFIVRNNPGTGVYASAAAGSAMRPKVQSPAYTPGWSAGTYDFTLTVTLLPNNAQKISWNLSSAPASATSYKYAGVYTNLFELTMPPAFDRVGIMGGAAIFQSASTSDCIAFTNLTVTFSNAGKAH